MTSAFVVDGPNPEEIMGAVVRIDSSKVVDSGIAITSCQPPKKRKAIRAWLPENSSFF